ncbi:hypothetical protein C8Q72DRAFT_787946, partial [Fomitopsis betulina]
LPVEVWERVMDHLWEDYPELLACSLVCEAWRPRSRFHLQGALTIPHRRIQTCLEFEILGRSQRAGRYAHHTWGTDGGYSQANASSRNACCCAFT